MKCLLRRVRICKIHEIINEPKYVLQLCSSPHFVFVVVVYASSFPDYAARFLMKRVTEVVTAIVVVSANHPSATETPRYVSPHLG